MNRELRLLLQVLLFPGPVLVGLRAVVFLPGRWFMLNRVLLGLFVVLAGLLMTLPLESPQALHLRKARRAEKKAAKAAQR